MARKANSYTHKLVEIHKMGRRRFDRHTAHLPEPHRTLLRLRSGLYGPVMSFRDIAQRLARRSLAGLGVMETRALRMAGITRHHLILPDTGMKGSDGTMHTDQGGGEGAGLDSAAA